MEMEEALKTKEKMSEDNTCVDENENENNIDDNILNREMACPSPSPWRTPLNSIPDPSQIPLSLLVYSNQKSIAAKSDALAASDARLFSNSNKGNGTPPTPKVVSGTKGCSNSAHTTPAKTVHGRRVSNIGCKVGSISRVPRGFGVLIANPEPVLQELPHFELAQHHSFWKDYNVQVLIRIRPLSNTEKMPQGYGRCLRQESGKTLVWLGHPETRFTFDHVACESISQEKLFLVAGLPMVENCMSGYNSCMFAYGQTGSGKTYTMMGDLCHSPGTGKLNEDSGITPRIFDCLFTRIAEEENKRKDEGLKYSCKCSFLEIYNEQITDLLEPSSTNLQLREDLKKGVYVENLTEYSVCTVDDVLKLLLQGAANRKMAATHMNSESSRSHSVFTCVIESHWEKDSMTHLRFGRLNLVDLAGSERQKSSGAEGDRLKEAANINKSLSTLGLVIMSLVDLAQGKQRHVPYRDSRLTFLLQDSLGGNSKTTIIANVSPSLCSANETLSTLKFAQRAKLIQNNAKVNEDACGDIMALQRQIHQLKGQLSILLKHGNSSEYFSHCSPSFKESCLGGFLEGVDSSEEMNLHDGTQSGISKKITCLKATLLGTLRREKLGELEVKKLEAEIEQMNRLVHQLEEDAQHTKMMLRFRDEKIKRLELLADSMISADNYLQDENMALREEIVLLQSSRENPEKTRLALENMRLLEQLKLYQCGQGERETLLAEISELRDQLFNLLEVENRFLKLQETGVAKELKEQRNMNSKLVSEIDEMQRELGNLLNYDHPISCSDKVALHRRDSTDELASYILPEDDTSLWDDGQKMERTLVLQFNDIQKELMNARSMIESLESNQICLIKELELVQKENHNLREISQDQKTGGKEHAPEPGDCNLLQAKLDKLSEDLNEAQLLNGQYLEDHALELLRNNQTQLVQAEVEMETTKTILHLQEEIATLQSELQGRLHSLAEENVSLRNCMAAKEHEIKALYSDWERATFELTTFLLDGSKSLKDASSQIESIASLFPCDNVWISDHVERAAKLCVEKDESILLLKRSLEDAQRTVFEMDKKLKSLRGATIALTEVQQMKHLEHKLMHKEDQRTDWDGSASDLCIPDSLSFLKNEEQCFIKDEQEQVIKPEMGLMVQNHEQIMQITDGGSNLTREADIFFTKFEEVQETMKEADYVLNALLKSNEDAKHFTSIWKQAGNNLMMQGEDLVGEIEQLTSSIHLRESTNELLQDQIHFILRDFVFLLEGFLQQDAEDLCRIAYSDAILMVKETLNNISSLRSLLEDISSKVKTNEIISFLLRQCLLTEHSNEISRLDVNSDFRASTLEEEFVPVHSSGKKYMSYRNESTIKLEKGEEEECQIETVRRSEAGEHGLCYNDLMTENMELKGELERKKVLLKGLLFDFSLLQESASSRKDAKDEIERLNLALNQALNELNMKTSQLDDVFIQQRTLEGRLAETENSLSISNFNLEQVRGTFDVLSAQNAELRMLLKDLYQKKSETEQQLEEQMETVKDLENEILRMTSSAEKNLASSVKEIQDDMARVIIERDELLDQIQSLHDKLDIAYALTDEKEAIALEARQESEASKVYAEQKEEEVKILEHSVEELERTINVLEKKVYEMEEEVERHRRIRDSLEVELHDMRERLLMVENMTEDLDSKTSSGELSENQLLRKLHGGSLGLREAHNQIRILEQDKEKLAKEIKQYREYVSELVVHAEAQASQYQQKYKNLELMVHEVTADSSNVTCGAPVLDKTEKTSMRTRGSSSPFRCIASLVHQMNLEKDQEYSIAKLRIEELEALVASRQKEVCLLNTRLASVESMTHDVIRDLLGVKLDINNYADLVSENQLQKLVEEAQQQAQQYITMEKEVVKLRRQINDVIEERERCILEMKRREADGVATVVKLEQVRERDQLLTAQNEMLKADKTNLQRRVAELDEMVKKLIGTQRKRIS